VLEGATEGEGGFARFATPEAGMAAMRKQIVLDTQRRGMTLRQFISKYAPKSENNTDKYISDVSRMTGIKPDDRITPDQIPALQRAMISIEGDSRAMAYYYPTTQPVGAEKPAGSTTEAVSAARGPQSSTSYASRGYALGSNARPPGAPTETVSPPTGPVESLPTITVTGRRIPSVERGYRPGMVIPSTGNPRADAYRRHRLIEAGVVPVAATTPSGTAVRGPEEPVPVHDAKATETLEDIKKSQGKVEKETRGLGQNTQQAARLYARRLRSTRRVLTPEEEADEYLKKAQQGFLNAFDRTLTKAFKDFGNNFLKSVGYAPGGRPVTAQEASRTGYAGMQLGKALDLDKKTASALEKVIGKEYSRMLAPAVSQLGKAYLNSLAIGIGQGLFSGTVGAQGAKALTGQIIGNFAKGNKQIAMEQLLFGLTGIASGPETIAQSYGFRSAAEGIGYMAEVFAAKSTNAIQGLFGWEDRTRAQQVRNPTTGRLYTPGEGFTGGVAMPDMERVGYGGMRLPQQPTTTLVGKQDNLLSTGARTLNGVLLVSVTNAGDFASEEDKLKHTLEQGFMGFTTRGMGELMGMGRGQGMRTPDFNPNANRYQIAQSTADLSMNQGNRYGLVGSEVASDISDTSYITRQSYELTAQGQRMSLNAMNASTQQNVSVTSQADQNNLAGMDAQTSAIVTAINSQPRATGGGSMGGSFGGDFASFLGNMAVSFVANKITSKIKNPYLRAAANFGIQAAAQKYVLPTILGTGGGAAAGGAAGSAGVAGAAGAGFLGSLAMLPSAFSAAGGFAGLGTAVGRSFGFFGGPAAGATFSQYAASVLGGSGFTTGANFFSGMSANSFGAAGSAFGTAGQFGYAVNQALPYTAAIMQLFQGDIKGAATTAALTYIGTAIGGPIGGFIGSVIGSVFGKKKKAPPPKIIDKVLVLADRDIAKKATVREENNPSDGQKQLIDAFLNTAFNTAMSIYQVSKINPPFNAIYISIRNANLKMALPSNYSGGTITDGWVYEVTMEEKKSSQFYMLEIMRKIREVYKAQSQDPEYLKKIDEGYALVASKSASQLAGGLIGNLKYGKYALDPSAQGRMGSATRQAVQSYVLGTQSGRTTVGTGTSGVTVSTQTTETDAGSLTPTTTSGTSVRITPTTSGAAGAGTSGTGNQNVNVVTDNSRTTNEGSTINTTYLNTTSGGDIYGRSGMNTGMSFVAA
jgi:hypothetical protein